MTGNLLQASLSGAILIAGILLFRRFARGRVPAAAVVLLWDIAALRLLIPWSLPQVAGIGTAAADLLQQGAKSAAEQTQAADALVIVWAAGAAAVAMWFSAGYVREARCLSSAVPLPTAEARRCFRLVPGAERSQIYISGDIVTAVAFGILRKRIVLPVSCREWSAETMRCVLTHELVHLRRADNLRRLLMLAATAVHWFNPLVWAAAAASEKDVEAACDARSVQLLGQHGRREYANALVDLAEQQSGLRIGASTFSSGAGVRERVKGVLRRARWTAGSIAAVLLVSACAVSSFAAGPVPHPEPRISEDVWMTVDTAFIVDAATGQIWDLQGNEIGRVDAQKGLSVEVEADVPRLHTTATVTYATSDSEEIPAADGE